MIKVAVCLFVGSILAACVPSDSLNSRHSSYGNDSEDSGYGHRSSDPQGPSSVSQERRDLIEKTATNFFGGEPVNEGAYSIDSSGIIRGPNVHQQISLSKTSMRPFAGGKAKAVIFHKTAGRTCKNGRVPKGYEKPHIYVCRDGSVIVNGSLNHPRTTAEAGHNDYSLSIEFEAAYAPKNTCQIPEGGSHCYEALTGPQMSVGKVMAKMMADYHDIPRKSALSIRGNDYYDYDTYVSTGSVKAGTNGRNKYQIQGFLPSFWTRQAYNDNSNHDDGPTLKEFKALAGLGWFS